MSRYFSPMRRQLGVVTLLVACLFMAGWVRSFHVEDLVVLVSDKYYHDRLTSNQAMLTRKQFQSEFPMSVSPQNLITTVDEDFRATLTTPLLFDFVDIRWRWRFGGFGVGEYTFQALNGHGLVTIWMIPYGSIVIPLTLISTRLLLSKSPVRARPSAPPASETA